MLAASCTAVYGKLDAEMADRSCAVPAAATGSWPVVPPAVVREVEPPRVAPLVDAVTASRHSPMLLSRQLLVLRPASLGLPDAIEGDAQHRG
jgi:hypothetical protein